MEYMEYRRITHVKHSGGEPALRKWMDEREEEGYVIEKWRTDVGAEDKKSYKYVAMVQQLSLQENQGGYMKNRRITHVNASDEGPALDKWMDEREEEGYVIEIMGNDIGAEDKKTYTYVIMVLTDRRA
ncbi:MAG: hypothetical protein OXT69_07135 [Candidatus Poribacteria bacterium]|nr:hypothetical protein [Candidatus Poribacteria bacterium]